MGITTEEALDLTLESYEPLRSHSRDSGKAFYETLFKLYPMTRSYFDHFGTTDDVLFSNPRFANHMAKVITSIGTMMDNLRTNNTEANEKIISRLAVIHRKKNVRPETTVFIKNTLLAVLNLEKGSKLEAAWVTVLTALMDKYNQQLEAEFAK